MRSIRHLTPRYIWNRCLDSAYRRLHPDHPWLTPQMIAMLETMLRPEDHGLEWGCGRSTLWFANRVEHLTSIEGDASWASTVASLLDARGLGRKVDLHLIQITNRCRESLMADYVTAASQNEPEAYDFCLVDGDLRDRCAKFALSLLKPGGLLIIDNVERYLPHRGRSRSPNSRLTSAGCQNAIWQEVHDTIETWRSIWTSNGVSDTALWIKP